MLAIFRRDLAAYLKSLTAWIVGASYLFLAGLLFSVMLAMYVDNSMMSMGRTPPNVQDGLIVNYMYWLGFLMMFVMPMLTMRLLAEERRSGTLELLFTYPVSEIDIVLAKFASAMTVITTILGLSAVSIFYIGTKTTLDWSLIASGYGGLLLLASCFVAIGLWASSLSASQVVAACVTYGMGMSLWLLQYLDRFMETVKEKLGGLGLLSHLESFARGSLTSHDLVYYLALTVLFLFLTVRVLDSRKWRM